MLPHTLYMYMHFHHIKQAAAGRPTDARESKKNECAKRFVDLHDPFIIRIVASFEKLTDN